MPVIAGSSGLKVELRKTQGVLHRADRIPAALMDVILGAWQQPYLALHQVAAYAGGKLLRHPRVVTTCLSGSEATTS